MGTSLNMEIARAKHKNSRAVLRVRSDCVCPVREERERKRGRASAAAKIPCLGVLPASTLPVHCDEIGTSSSVGDP